MSKVLLAGLAVVGVFVFTALLLVFGYIGFSNTANKFEVDIKAKYTDNRNVYDNGWKRVKEVAQVPDLYTDQLLKLYDATMTGRYGADGSKAMFQFIKEQNPTIDAALFRSIQQNIEAFRNEFQSNQTMLISRKQAYETFLSATTSGRFYNMLGAYPHIDLTKFDIMTSDKTEQDFATKKSEPLNLK